MLQFVYRHCHVLGFRYIVVALPKVSIIQLNAKCPPTFGPNLPTGAEDPPLG